MAERMAKMANVSFMFVSREDGKYLGRVMREYGVELEGNL
jgi:hypothetical protein